MTEESATPTSLHLRISGLLPVLNLLPDSIVCDDTAPGLEFLLLQRNSLGNSMPMSDVQAGHRRCLQRFCPVKAHAAIGWAERGWSC